MVITDFMGIATSAGLLQMTLNRKVDKKRGMSFKLFSLKCLSNLLLTNKRSVSTGMVMMVAHLVYILWEKVEQTVGVQEEMDSVIS